MIYQPDAIYSGEFLREHTPDELRAGLSGARKLLHELRSQKTCRKGLSPNIRTHYWKKVRRDIARFLTVINEGGG